MQCDLTINFSNPLKCYLALLFLLDSFILKKPLTKFYEKITICRHGVEQLCASDVNPLGGIERRHKKWNKIQAERPLTKQQVLYLEKGRINI